MADCKDCNRTDIKCCPTCARNPYTCNVWHLCEKDCEGYEPRIKSQADRIRAMSDEELAEWLTKITDDAQRDAITKCDYQWGDWLKSEVKE